ncbi:MAG: hypothetical protein ABIH42_09905, partial [Planctomycetota bacterium]
LTPAQQYYYMVTFSEAARYLKTRRILLQLTHSRETIKYHLELSKKNVPQPISLPQWLFKEG